jgi:rod shape-determining protein MreD
MRRTVLTVGSLAVALVLQLVVLNGLHLPGGGVPDLVLVLVAVLAITSGPVPGMVAGFLAGLALDLAPPGSAVLGEYALVLFLVGWAAGKLGGVLERSALQSLVLLAGVVALGEAAVSGLTLALDPAQVSWAGVRQLLPSAVGYDLLLLPFLLYLALLAAAWASASDLHRDTDSAGVLAVRSRAAGAHQNRKQRVPHLDLAAGRPHDGWVGSGPAGRAQAPRRAAVPHGLRPGHGVAGSAVTNVTSRPRLTPAPVNLRLSSRRRGFGVLGNPVGSALNRHPVHPGLRSTSSRHFRPHSGVPGGSAAGQAAGLIRPTPLRPGQRRAAPVRFGTRRGDGSVGRLLGTPRPAGSGPGLLDRTGRSTSGLRFRHAASPRFRTGSLAAPRSRQKAVPRFGRAGYAAVSPGLAGGLAGGLRAAGTLDQRELLAARRRLVGVPRLRLAGGRRGDGQLGGAVRGLLRSARPGKPATPRFRAGSLVPAGGRPEPKRPQFGYGRRSVLSFLAARGIGGRWLARKRAGSRSGAWLIGRRTGGIR